MITPDQETWLAHLSDLDRVAIVPFDPTAQAKFEAVREKIFSALGPGTRVEHRGATSLGISGQDEIDVYVPVPESEFEGLLPRLAESFGPPRSLYPRERARFATSEEGKRVDIFLINESCRGWLEGCRFDSLLRANPGLLRRYEELKAAGDGLSTRAYYRRKLEFINEVLSTGT